MRVGLRRDSRRGHRERRTGAETADDRAADHQRDARGERRRAVADAHRQQPGPRRPSRAEPFHACGEREAGRGGGEQEDRADQARLGGGESEPAREPADDGREQVRGEITGREKGDKGPQSTRARRHGRSRKRGRGGGAPGVARDRETCVSSDRWPGEVRRGRNPSIVFVI
ncbi:hypothetical protein GCM10010272_61460 [Streptomyces lateritius]|nr:hypothetical protein GCM10010272_61460 [Streptomyces lateritius]